MKKTIITAICTCFGLAFTLPQVDAATMTTGSADYTVSGSGTLQTTDKSTTAVLTGTITVTGMATFAPSTDAGASYANVWMSSSAFGPISTGGSYSIPAISNADITITGEYKVRRMDLTASSLTITSTGSLTVEDNANYTLKVGAVTIEAGGQLKMAGTTIRLEHNGAISLALNDSTLEGSGTTYTTSALYGTMNSGSSVALNLAGATTLPTSGTTFTLTLNMLTGATDNTLGTDDFTVSGLTNGWTLNSVAAATTGTGTTLTFTRDLPVPEPATATLSLLALASLAARRRRK